MHLLRQGLQVLLMREAVSFEPPKANFDVFPFVEGPYEQDAEDHDSRPVRDLPPSL